MLVEVTIRCVGALVSVISHGVTPLFFTTFIDFFKRFFFFKAVTFLLHNEV